MKLCPKCQKHFSDDANFCPVDAARLLPLDAAQADGTDSLTSRFELGDKIGGSRTGGVYLATEKLGGQAVVIKLVAPAVLALPGVAGRLDRELKQLERIQSSGVAKLIASGKRDDQVWMALEPVRDAHTLADAIAARGPIELAGAAQLIEVIGEALIEAAQVGVVHRDLAPKNILFAGDQVRLINFSLPVPTTEKVPGVAEFVAPEQVDGKPVDQRGNLYSLGALYYYVLTGEPPFTGDTQTVHAGHTGGTIRPPSQLVSVPAPVEALIMRALERSPTKRFLTVRQFVDEVGRIARGEEVIDLKSTQAMGKAGMRKAELVQTLLGVRSGADYVTGSAAQGGSAAHASAPLPASAPVATAATIASAPTVTTAPVAAPPTVITELGSAPAPAAAPPAAMAATVAPTSGRSPWAPPADAIVAPAVAAASGAATAPVIATPVASAAPAVAAPVVAAPVVAAPSAPVVTGAPAGKRKADDGDGNKKGKFRETMWFKKGEMDSAAAAAAEQQRAATGKDVATDKADSLPIDERYKDDGTISRGDKEKYSLRTGGTQMLQAIRSDDPGTSGSRVSEDALIGEMKRGRGKIFALIGAGLVAIAMIIVLLVAR